MPAAPDDAQIVSILEDYVSQARRDRIEHVLGRRLARVTVVVEDVYDPHNAAAILRTCEALGLCQVHVIEGQHRFRVSDKVTQGAESWLDVQRHVSAKHPLEMLRKQGFRLAGAVPTAALSLPELPLDQPIALIFGNEHAGLSSEARAAMDCEFGIVMDGFTQSLNISVAVAVALYDVTQRIRTGSRQGGDLDDATKLRLRAYWYRQSVRGADALLRRLS